jgi:ubiquinone biosynthesis protein
MFDLILLLRKASSTGLLIILSQLLKRKSLILLSFIFSPINSLLYIIKLKNADICTSLEKLGTIFVKFGQALSTRADIIGEDIAESLKSLQDNLQPFETKVAISIFEEEFNTKISEIFKEFDKNPVAAASIAQVHKAKLLNGKEVAVKILRPNIRNKYQRDIKLLYKIADFSKRFIRIFANIKLVEAVRIFEKTMNQELDLKNEAANCSALSDLNSKDENIIIPRIYWDYSNSRVITMEWIDGVSIYDKKLLEFHGFKCEEITKKIAISFFNQAFTDGFFHADLHPGNILVTNSGKIAFLDFGIVGFLSEKDRLGLAEILYSLLKKDYYRVAEIHQEIGFVPSDINLHEFAIACRAVSEPIVGKPANKLSVGHLIENLIRMTSEFGMQTQPQLILLQKNIILLEGLGQILAPDVNMWNLAEPWITKWAKVNLGFDAKLLRLAKKLIQNLKKEIKTL